MNEYRLMTITRDGEKSRHEEMEMDLYTKQARKFLRNDFAERRTWAWTCDRRRPQYRIYVRRFRGACKRQAIILASRANRWRPHMPEKILYDDPDHLSAASIYEYSTRTVSVFTTSACSNRVRTAVTIIIVDPCCTIFILCFEISSVR